MHNDDLASDLNRIRKNEHLPALAAAVEIKGELRAIAAVGKRRIDGKKCVTVNDKWHLGSCTKPMTSTLAGMLVEQKKIGWLTSVADVFDEWRSEIDNGWLGATLEQLLSHRAGAPHAAPDDLWQEAWKHIGTPTEQRKAFVKGLLRQPPRAVPGTTYEYSNQGYSIAGLMLEMCTGRDWESLMQELVFRPLGMKSAGFGAPGDAALTDQPCGHTGEPNRLKAIAPGPSADNPAAIGPAGIVHCSIHDLARFAASHAGSNQIVSDTTLQKIHTPILSSDYSLGWIVVDRDWGGGRVLSHGGSNTYWYAVMWVAPLRNAVFVAATNAAGSNGPTACDQAVSSMIQRHLDT